MMAVVRIMKPVLVVVLLMCLLSGALEAQERSYQEMRAEVVALFQAESFAEAATILEGALPQYPDHLVANTTNLAIMRVSMEDLEGAVEALFYGLSHDVWYSKYAFLAEFWAPLRETTAFGDFQALNEMARARAQLQVRPRLEVSLPESYDPSKRYPLFLALHGGGENIDVFMPEWNSPLLEQEFIVAFPSPPSLWPWTASAGLRT
jgi:hypothetical protein